MNKKFEDWKRQEPGARQSQNERNGIKKSEQERAQMEQKANAPFTLSMFDPWSLKFKISNASVFSVTLKRTLPISEIYERMEKAFGDLK